MLTQAVAKGARKAGGQILQNVKVMSTKQTQDGEWEVETNQGRIKAKRIVNAAGEDRGSFARSFDFIILELLLFQAFGVEK